MKKKISILIICLIPTLIFTTLYTYAQDFEGREDKYIQLCSSSKLTNSQQSTCQEFNTYLQKKNQQLQQESQAIKDDVEDTKSSIEELEKKLTEYDTKIKNAQNEMTYLNQSIERYNQQIQEKNELMEERLYIMQPTFNSNVFVNYLFQADSFSDFMSRIASIHQITSYEQELILQLEQQIKEVEKQKSTLEVLEANLKKDQAMKESLQKTYLAKLEEQNQTIAQNDSEVSKNQESMDVIKANLAAIKKASQESKVNNVTQATPSKKPSTPKPQPKPETKPSDNDTPENTTPSQDPSPSTPSDEPETQTPTETNSEELGLMIANKALTRQGYMYVWGGCHSWAEIKNPNQTAFDCSGLVNWSHYQCGVNLGRIHYTGSLVSAGKSVSKSELQPGDIILFSSNGTQSGVHHVGIYIGNNQMVHAPTEGSPVQVANLSYSYWQNEWYCCRRLY